MPGLAPPWLAPKTPFDRPSAFYGFLASPVAFLARFIYRAILRLRGRPKPLRPTIKVVCISDTHKEQVDIPEGDVLIHAGDLTVDGTVAELQQHIDWLQSLPHPHKIVIAGNHDTYLDVRSRRTLSATQQAGTLDWGTLNYLQHDSMNLTFPSHENRSLKVYGAPQIPACGGANFAFQYPRRKDAWTGTIPFDVDILVTHTPPRWHLDLPRGLGCEYLLKEVWEVRPLLHVFGHIHAARGSEVAWWDDFQAAYERVCIRECSAGSKKMSDRKWLDLIRLDLSNWIDLARIVVYGSARLAWSLLWGGVDDGTIMVNAAVMSQQTGKPDNAPQVVLL